MKNPVKVVILPTEGDIAPLWLYSGNRIEIHCLNESLYRETPTPQHIYITVSQDVEHIKEGDWVYFYSEDVIIKFNSKIYGLSDCRKIIATTDPGLYITVGEHYDAYNKELPKIPLSFLKEFVANPDGEWEVEYESYFTDECERNEGNEDGENIQKEYKLKLNPDNTVLISSAKEEDSDDIYRSSLTCNNCASDINLCECKSEEKMYSREEVEAMIRKYENDNIYYGRDGYYSDIDIAGKWIKENL